MVNVSWVEMTSKPNHKRGQTTMNIDKKELPRLLPFQTFMILREGLEPIEIMNPTNNERANEIFDLIVRASDSHKLKSLKRLRLDGDSIVMTFVDEDDEDGIELDADDVELLARWLEVMPPPTIDDILEEVMNERNQLNMMEVMQ